MSSKILMTGPRTTTIAGNNNEDNDITINNYSIKICVMKCEETDIANLL